MGEIVDRDRLRAMLADGARVVEVLPAKEYAEDHLPGATSLPLTRLDRASAAALSRDRPLIVYCWDAA